MIKHANYSRETEWKLNKVEFHLDVSEMHHFEILVVC